MTSSAFNITTYDSSLRVAAHVFNALRSKETSANCILPILLKSHELESKGQHPPQKQAWVVCSSRNHVGEEVVELILSVTEGYIDSYPVFIFAASPLNELTRDYIRPRMGQMVNALAQAIPLRRVYAVFGPHPLSLAFAHSWTNLTGILNYIEQPYYAAKMSFCTIKTLRLRPLPLQDDLIPEIRPAHHDETMAIAHCCFGFAADSAPYLLTQEGAIREAKFLVTHSQVWIHRIIHKATSQSDIASVVAFTRNSEKNATITKVYTNPNWRRMGCAERLVGKVCEFLLQTKSTVSLFVAHDNPGAALVYSRVGFVGLDSQEGAVTGVENWTEIGFDREFVKLGHW